MKNYRSLFMFPRWKYARLNTVKANRRLKYLKTFSVEREHRGNSTHRLMLPCVSILYFPMNASSTWMFLFCLSIFVMPECVSHWNSITCAWLWWNSVWCMVRWFTGKCRLLNEWIQQACLTDIAWVEKIS